MDPGFIFAPADHVLTDEYLGGEIAGLPVASTYIDHGDVYSALPEELVSGRRHVRDRDGNDACFLYTPVRFATENKTGHKLRKIDDDPMKSYWHSEGGKTPVEGSETGGYVQDFTHAIKDTAGRTRRTGWRMKEYGLWTEHGDSDIAICKVYHTRRKPSKTASTSTTSSASSSVEENVAVCSHPAINSKKRKATADPEDSTLPSARPRLSHEHPTTTTTDPEPETADDELLQIYCKVLKDDSFFQSVQLQELPSNNVAVTTRSMQETMPADDQMYARLSEEGAHQEPDEPIYGLPPPAFSPEMISSCSDEWPSLVTFIDVNDLY